MNKLMQKTIQTPAEASGIGLHQGKLVRMRLVPAEADTGIVFRRIDLDGAPTMKAAPELVQDTNLCTGLCDQERGLQVFTVEHLMSALYGLGIDNIIVELDAPEIPIFDGSSAPFMFLIENAGIKTLDKPKKLIKVLRTVEVVDGPKVARIRPDDSFSVNIEIDYKHPVIPAQSQRFDITGDVYRRGISRARTFCFQGDVEKMQQHGLALGGGLDNAIVVGDFSVINPGGLRYEDEFIRHKTLDCIGDLYMLGYPIIGAFEAVMPGHGMNNKLLRKLMENKLNWRFVEAPADSDILPLSA